MLDDVRFGWRKLQQQPGFTVVAVSRWRWESAPPRRSSASYRSLADRATLPSPRNTRAHSARPNRRAPSQREALVGGAVERVAARLQGVRVVCRIWLVVQLPRHRRWQRVARGDVRQQGLLPRRRARTRARPPFSDAEVNFPPAPVIVIGYDLWQRKFGGDPNIIGTKVRISRRETPPTIIGVMAPGVRFLPSPATAQGRTTT